MSVERPDVLLIQADQFRWDCLGSEGNPDVQTPHLDELAGDGVRFSEAFCPFPVCTPSRYSMLSGLHVHQHGGWTNRSTLPSTITTFPGRLRRAGYRTAAVGKMHFTPTYLDVGYDSMVLAEQDGPGRYDDDYHRDLRAAGLAPVADLHDQEPDLRDHAPATYWTSYGAGRSDLPERWHSTTWIGDRAEQALTNWGDDCPNLLHVSFIKPHHPFDPPAPWDEFYDPNALTIPAGWTDVVPAADAPHLAGYFDYAELSEPALRRVLAHYYATITQLDHQIGRLLQCLRETGRYDNTVIIFTSDHGEYLGFHRLLLKWGPMYDPVMRVPLLIKFPAGHPSGELRDGHDDRLVSLVDIAPTVLTTCGLDLDRSASARAGLDLGTGQSRDVVVAENRVDDEVHYMVRSRTHKLLAHPDPTRDALFDLVADPCELDNRIKDAEYAGVAARMREQLATWMVFDTPTPVCRDPNARQISAPNVPAHDGARHQEHRSFFRRAAASSSNNVSNARNWE